MIEIERVTHDLLFKGYTYSQYRQLLNSLMANGRTTGPDQSDKLIAYARLNQQRMARLDKTASLQPDLLQVIKSIDRPQYWMVLTEGWCGDAAQNLPVIAKAAGANIRIDLRLLLRDEHPYIMDQYLYNGTRSIPRLVIFDRSTLAEWSIWGPRPEPAQQIVNEGKRLGKPHDEWVEAVHAWYAKDKTITLQQELRDLIFQQYG